MPFLSVAGAGRDFRLAPKGDVAMNSATEIKRFLLAFLFTIVGFSLLFVVLTTKVI